MAPWRRSTARNQATRTSAWARRRVLREGGLQGHRRRDQRAHPEGRCRAPQGGGRPHPRRQPRVLPRGDRRRKPTHWATPGRKPARARWSTAPGAASPRRRPGRGQRVARAAHAAVQRRRHAHQRHVSRAGRAGQAASHAPDAPMLPETAARSAKMGRQGMPGYDADFPPSSPAGSPAPCSDTAGIYTSRAYMAPRRFAATRSSSSIAPAAPTRASARSWWTTKSTSVTPTDEAGGARLDFQRQRRFRTASTWGCHRRFDPHDAAVWHRGLPFVGQQVRHMTMGKEILGAQPARR
jgi:hypothetical protein